MLDCAIQNGDTRRGGTHVYLNRSSIGYNMMCVCTVFLVLQTSVCVNTAAPAAPHDTHDRHRSCGAGDIHHEALVITAAAPFAVLKLHEPNAITIATKCCEICASNITGCGAFFVKAKRVGATPAGFSAVCHLFDPAAAANLKNAPCSAAGSEHICVSAVFPKRSRPRQRHTPAKKTSTIPTCRELMSRPNSPFANGAFLTRKTTQIVWKPRADGSRRLTLPTTCRLERYTAQKAKQCLAGKSLAFIGDSLSRYSFWSLAHFLEKGAWPPRFKMDSPCPHLKKDGSPSCSPKGHPNICLENDWARDGKRGWHGLMQAAGGGTDGDLFNGRMECPCYRKEALGPEDHQPVNDMQYATAPLTGGGGPRTVLTYVQELGWGNNPDPLEGWNFTGCAFSASCRFSEEMWLANKGNFDTGTFDRHDKTVAEAVGANGYLRALLPRVDYALYNRGLWGALPKDVSDKTMKALFDWTGGKQARTSGSRCFFRSTTACERARENKLGKHERLTIKKSAFAAGCEFFDVAHVTEEFGYLNWKWPNEGNAEMVEYNSIFWDSVHYMPWVYEELNNLLLNVLCNTAGGGGSGSGSGAGSVSIHSDEVEGGDEDERDDEVAR